jgi:hypothetical protein
MIEKLNVSKFVVVAIVMAALSPTVLATPSPKRTYRYDPASQGQEGVSMSGVRAHVRLEALGTLGNGPTGEPALESGATLAPGDRMRRYFVAGNGSQPDLCEAGFLNGPSSRRAFYVWEIEVSVLAVSAASTTLELKWARSDPGSAATPVVRTVTLAPGEYHLFDYIAASADASPTCANLTLRVLADPVPQSDPQPLLSYDLWLEYQGPHGPRWSHRRVEGLSTRPIRFTLEPLCWSDDGKPVRQRPDAIELSVVGDLRATLSADGYVDVSISALRKLTWNTFGRGDQGREEYRARLGESVAILLPEPEGRLGAPSTDSSRGGSDTNVPRGVDVGRFFSGSRVSLYVVIHRAR